MSMNIHFVKMMKRNMPSGKGVALGYPWVFNEHRDKLPPDELFKALKVTVDVIDIKSFGFNEIIWDLNRPIPIQWVGKYDFLINPGTYEHCFNISQAMLNGYNLVKPNGLSFHTAPIARGKHGFWNFNDCTFREFYSHNGGSVLHQETINKSLFVCAKNAPEKNPIGLPYERRNV